MTMEDAIIVHSPDYANWIFDKSHPTQGRRFLHGRNRVIIEGQNRQLNIDEFTPEIPHTDDLLLVHDPIYVHDVTVKGLSDEWDGPRHDLGDLAKLFVGGTLTAVDLLLEEKTKLAIHLPGAKHHAMRDYSSGFCIFNDLAIAATKLTQLGKKVAIFDCDAHHGDGTEALTKANPNIMSFSVHQWGIFPGTGLVSDWERKALNFPLAAGTDDEGLKDATQSFLDVCFDFEPDFIFIACGADGLADDPLSELKYTVGGYELAMKSIRMAYPDTPILFGGAGGYLPDDQTPDLWAKASLALVAPKG
jgi:acetoin utilization deacetylase AcuC-like enzyme